MAALSWKINATDGRARAGEVTTPHGVIPTPAFVPVGTQATVKGLDSGDLKTIGVPVVFANAYHLYLRPGPDIVAEQGGLHSFMAWDRPIMTDSGGFQVFSLGSGLEQGVGKVGPTGEPNTKVRPGLMKVDEDGVSFRSHLDNSRHRFTPERSIEIQEQLGADIIMAFDECTSPLDSESYTAEAMARTHRWAERSLAAWQNRERQALYGIVQGGVFRRLREESARFIDKLDFAGTAIGGAFGREEMYTALDWIGPLLDPAKARHLLGIGTITDIFNAVARGMDTFDCVEPTRLARHGNLYIGPIGGGNVSNRFRLDLLSERYARDGGPIEPGCSCAACQHYSRAYLRHLFAAGETLGPRLATIHNLHFIQQLTQRLAAAIHDSSIKQMAAGWGVALEA